ncbi:hypothetical protein PMKS-002393 [Pichia membranifaciens]|uniref:Uncharacterized protein n=1 Tax=Pichia membranifaciens TaxID=4926 RepID=A0A1Q2YHE7_9ASCO|nr:hypothetical protein PMKS-002393 [Pichia membranifaciens]
MSSKPATATATAGPENHQRTQLHKTVTAVSKDSKWVSPFRVSGAVGPKVKSKNPGNYSSYITAGSTPVATKPAAEKVAPAETTEAEEEAPANVAAEAAEGVANAEYDEEAPIDETEEPLEPTATSENAGEELEEPIGEDAAEAVVPETEVAADAEVTEDEAAEPAAAEPAAAELKEKKALPAVQEVPALIKSHPKMLRRYKDNFNITSQIMNKNRIENLDRRVNLGAGLVLTEEQIYELARKKLEPLMKQIDDRVAENNARDAAAAAKVEEGIRLNDEAVVAKELSQYKSSVDAKTKSVKADHEKKIKELADKAANSKSDTEKHIQDQKDGIVKDEEDAENAEEDAVQKHITDKETLIETADKLKEDKTKELEDAKAKQIEETELTEKFHTDATELQSKQVDLQSELDAKKAELEEKIKKVEALIAAKHEKKESIRSSIKRRKVADRSFNIIDAKHTQAAANFAILSNQVGLLNDRLAAHSTKIGHLNTTGKDTLTSKRAEAKKASDDWEDHLAQVRLDEAKKQEQIRIAAEEERKRVEQEKLDEEARLKKEKEEEEARLQKEKEEEEARLQKEKEEKEAKIAKEKEENEAKIAREKADTKIAAEKKKKEEEEEATRVAEEVARMKRLKELNEEKFKLQKSLDEHKKVEAAAAAKAKEESEKKSKSAEASSSGAGILAGVGAAMVGAAATGTAAAGAAASGVAGSIGNPLGASASEGLPSYQDELAKSDAGNTSSFGTNNPFYLGEFNDKKEDDVPSTIHEEDEVEAPLAVVKDATKVEKPVTPVATKEFEKIEDPLNDTITITEKAVSPLETASSGLLVANDEEPVSEAERYPVPTEMKPADDSALTSATRRRSMVDEAIAHMTPAELDRMNTPLSQQINTKEPTTPTTVEGKSRSNSLSKSRSNSLTSKFKFKKSGTKTKSRSNSIKNETPKQTVTAKKSNPKLAKSNTSKAAAPVSTTTAISSPPVPATPTIESSSAVAPVPTTPASAVSIAPSGLSEAAEVSEAKAVEIKPTTDESPEKVASGNGEQDSSDDDDDSDLAPTTVNPVFTEKIGVAETAPTTASTEPAADTSNYVEVSTLETVSSNEYKQNKDDPNYMVLHS